MGVNCVYLSANAPPSSLQPCSVERRLREGSFRNPKVLTLEMGSNSNLREGFFFGGPLIGNYRLLVTTAINETKVLTQQVGGVE